MTIESILDDLQSTGWLVQSLGQVGASCGWLAILAHGLDIHTGTGSSPSMALAKARYSAPRTGYIRGLEPPATDLRALLPKPKPMTRRF